MDVQRIDAKDAGEMESMEPVFFIKRGDRKAFTKRDIFIIIQGLLA